MIFLTDRWTNNQTDRQTDMSVHREVTLSKKRHLTHRSAERLIRKEVLPHKVVGSVHHVGANNLSKWYGVDNIARLRKCFLPAVAYAGRKWGSPPSPPASSSQSS